MKTSTFLLFLLLPIFLFSQKDESDLKYEILIRNINVIPETSDNKGKYENILRTIKEKLVQIFSEENYIILPEYDKAFEDTNGEINQDNFSIVIWSHLKIPEPLIQETDYNLQIELIRYDKDGKASRKMLPLNLANDPKEFLNIIDREKKRIIGLLQASSDREVRLEEEWSYLKRFEEGGYDLAVKGDSYQIMRPLDTFYHKYDYYYSFIKERCYPYDPYCKKFTDMEGRPLLEYIEAKVPSVNRRQLDLSSIFWERKYNWKTLGGKAISPKLTYNVLLFPFDHYDNCDRDISKFCTKAVREMLIRESHLADIKIDVRINKQFNNPDSPLDYDTAKKIGKICGADLILWGDYEKQCEWDSTLVNIKYLPVDEESTKDIFGGKRETGFKKIDAISSLIYEKNLVGDIKDIVYFSLGKAIGSCEKKKQLFDKISIPKDKPEYINILLELIDCSGRKGNYAEKEALFAKAAKIDSTNFNLLTRQAYHYYKQNDVDKGIYYYEQINKLYPVKLNAANLAELYLRKRNTDKAIQVIEEYYKQPELKSLSFQYYYYKGEIYRRSGGLDSVAIINFRKAIEAYPEFTDIYLKLSQTYIRTGEYILAKEILDEAQKYESESWVYSEVVEARINLNLFWLKDTVAVLKDYDALIVDKPNPFSMKKYRAKRRDLLTVLNRYDEAFLDNNILQELFPMDESYFMWEVNAKNKTGNIESAIISLDNKILKKRNPVLLLERGISYSRLGEFQLAKYDFKEVASLDTLGYESYSWISYLYSQPGFFNQDSLVFYMTLANQYNEFLWKNKKNSNLFFYSRYSISNLPLYSFGGGYKIDDLDIYQIYNYLNAIEENITKIFPHEMEYLGQSYLTLVNLKFTVLLAMCDYESCVELVNKITSGYYPLDEKRVVYFRKQLTYLYAKQGAFEKAFLEMDNYLFSRLNTVEKREKNKNIIRFFTKSKKLEFLRSKPEFQKIIEKYEWLVNNKS